MLTRRKRLLFLLAYVALCLLEFYAESLLPEQPTLRLFAKPALLTALSLYFSLETRKQRSRQTRLFQTALAFAWLGDVLLMRRDGFLSGLGAFLVMQVLYTLVFWKKPKHANAGAVVGIVGYAVLVFLNCQPGLGNLLLPVLVYLAVVVAMAFAAFSRRGHVSVASFRFVAVGAGLFVLSDSFIALTRFGSGPLVLDWLVMPTYAAAQYLIVEGVLGELRDSHHRNFGKV
ncbi:MAG: lysoplasmalogenase [Sphingobacteriaceae bacterium]|nr:lysoplasmalogenase [Cytophagaceae bacterium]